MRKKLLLTTLVVLMVFITSCGEDSGETPTTSSGSTFIGGSNGLEIEFMEGAPPTETYDGGGNNFGIAVRIENKGETVVDANNAELTITGIDPSDFNVVQTDLEKMVDVEITSRKKDPQGNELPGGIQIIDFGNSFDYTGTLSGNQQFTTQANICYQYGTKAVSKLCVEDDLLDPTKEGAVCEANDDKKVESSAAPIRVESSLKESVAGSAKITFTFGIKHVGSGAIYDSEQTELCTNENQYENVVNVEVNTGIDGTLSCAGLSGTDGQGSDSGSIKLYSGARTISCTQDLNTLGDYEKELTITLTYDYKQHESASILVRHI